MHELFYEDAIVLKNLKSTQVTFVNRSNKNGFHFKFNNFLFFGIWAAKDAPFICLEPWCGIADSISHNKKLTEKEGIIKLLPKSDWERLWSVHCY
jgi:galactose mutarotase-like enzyme